MDNRCTINHGNQQIIVVDLSDTRPGEQQEYLAEMHKLISSQPEKSVLLLTDVTNARYDAESASALKDWASKNTPFIKASAVVGATGFLNVLLGTVRLITGRDIRQFDSRTEAMDWLTSAS